MEARDGRRREEVRELAEEVVAAAEHPERLPPDLDAPGLGTEVRAEEVAGARGDDDAERAQVPGERELTEGRGEVESAVLREVLGGDAHDGGWGYDYVGEDVAEGVDLIVFEGESLQRREGDRVVWRGSRGPTERLRT